MCMKIECSSCHKATWRGCGMHIESALSGVPLYDRCPGWPTGKCSATSTGSKSKAIHDDESALKKKDLMKVAPNSKDDDKK